MKKIFGLLIFSMHIFVAMESSDSPTSLAPLVHVKFKKNECYCRREDLLQLRVLKTLLQNNDTLDFSDVDLSPFTTLMSLVALTPQELELQMAIRSDVVDQAIEYAIQFDYAPVTDQLIHHYAEGNGKKSDSCISPRHEGLQFVSAVEICKELADIASLHFGVPEFSEDSHSLTQLRLFFLKDPKVLPPSLIRQKLTALNLIWNESLVLASQNFKDFTTLLYLNLSHCSIKKLPQDVFMGLKNLKELYLDSNPEIRKLRSQHGDDLSSLRLLSIRGCSNIKKLPQTFSFKKHKTLEKIITIGSGLTFADGSNPESIEVRDLDSDDDIFVSSGSRRIRTSSARLSTLSSYEEEVSGE